MVHTEIADKQNTQYRCRLIGRATFSLSERDGEVLIGAVIYCTGSARSRTVEHSVSALLLTAGAGLGPPDIQRAHSDK